LMESIQWDERTELKTCIFGCVRSHSMVRLNITLP